MIPLPTLSDKHGNDLGVVAGAAENTTIEPSCPTYDPAAFQFQQYQFKPVLWRHHGIEELATVGGDLVGAAKVVNNKGQAVGATGTCSVFGLIFPFPMQPLHAVLWEQDGTPIDLGSLGGNEKSLWGNLAESINNSGHVVGSSSLSDNVTLHAFFWTRETGRMQDLGPIKNNTQITNSLAIAINDGDDVVGSSLDFATQLTRPSGSMVWLRT
jgi:probable HAF family extracellular repeat protein